MPTLIALLRGINVGGKRMKMADLRTMFDELGYQPNQTLLASGNVVFNSDESEAAQVTQTIEAAIVATFGFESRIVLRTVDELQSAVDHVPFSLARLEEAPKQVTVMFLNEAPLPARMDALLTYDGAEMLHVDGREVYVDYREGQARSKLTTNFMEKQLGVVGTVRNWSTTRKLLELAQGFSGG